MFITVAMLFTTTFNFAGGDVKIILITRYYFSNWICLHFYIKRGKLYFGKYQQKNIDCDVLGHVSINTHHQSSNKSILLSIVWNVSSLKHLLPLAFGMVYLVFSSHKLYMFSGLYWKSPGVLYDWLIWAMIQKNISQDEEVGETT